ncbi:MAG TPA: TraK family protein [Candidatus Desulfovibrio intestinigallinarum]|nr:TraK family protein [Candidatus Desulfovibrio intestinigallinarum]
MSFPKKRLRSGFARVEFLAVRQEIEDLISKGYSIKTVHEMLQKDGKISMSYDAFRRFVTGKTSAAVLAGARTQNHVTDSKAKSAALDKSHPRLSPGEGPQIIGGTRKTFQKNIVPDEELF